MFLINEIDISLVVTYISMMYKKPIVLLIVLLILIAGGITVYKQYNSKSKNKNVTIETVDLRTAKGENKLPKGFPRDIPVDLSNVTESFSANYEDDKVLQGGFTFMSQQTKDEAYNSYLTSITNSGYILDTQNTNKEAGYILGTKDGSQISFAITEINNSVQIQVAYTNRL